ncbi:MAG: amidase [Pseudomonadales bacterium]|nr:amidase [Pseudomonadales bacterium]
MIDTGTLELDAIAIGTQLARGDLAATELTRSLLDAIDRDNPQLRAYTHVFADQALLSAAESDARRVNGAGLGPLDGIPIAIKGNIAVAGWPQHAGLEFLRTAPAMADAFVVRRLRTAGAILLGLTNLDEGALGAAGVNPHFGTVANPRVPAATTGGSSAGSAAALAAHLTTLAIGTDTIGSVRIPASYCGLTALKPTFGAISTGGIVATHQRFDHVGPMARSVRDLVMLLDALVGWDRECRVSFPLKFRARNAGNTLRIGFITGFDDLAPDAPTIEGYDRAINALRRAGHTLSHFDVAPWQLQQSYRAIFALCEIEMARAHAGRLGTAPESFSPSLRKLLKFGRSQTGTDMQRYEWRVARFVANVQRVFTEIDVLLAPTTPTTAFPSGAAQATNSATFTSIASATGRPAVVVPVNADPKIAPASVQLIGQAGNDYVLLRLAQSLEAAIS